MTGRRRMKGFTLLEILVAMAIFSVVAVTVYGRAGDVIMQTGSLEARTFATWIAQNGLTRLQLELAPGELPATGHSVESVSMAGRDWELVTEITATSAAGLRRVEIRVHSIAEQGERSSDAVARLTGFVGRY